MLVFKVSLPSKNIKINIYGFQPLFGLMFNDAGLFFIAW